jgi:hypothetical protein
MISLADLMILLSVWYIIIIIHNIIKKYKQDQLFKQQVIIKKQELFKQQEAIKKQQQEAIKKQEVIKKQQEKEEECYYDENYDNILLLIILECFNYKQEPINKIIKKIINKCKYTEKLDKDTKYIFNDIFNESSIDKQIDLIKLIFSLDNVKNKEYLLDNIFIDRYETGDELLEYGIKNNMYDLCKYVFESKSYKIDLDKYIELEKMINNKEMYLLLIKHKIEDEYHNMC